MQFSDHDLAEVTRIVRDPLTQCRRIVLSLLRRTRYIGRFNGGVVLAVLPQIRRQDFHIPAAPGTDLARGGVRAQSEEARGLERMAVLVASREFRSARGTGNRGSERILGLR